MAADLRAFARSIQLLPKTMMGEADFKRLHADIWRAEHRKIVEAENPSSHRVFVDGREGAAPETVKLGGVIVSRYSYLAEVAAFALETLREISPVDSGDYKASHFLLHDGGEVPELPEAALEFFVTNDVPYARKLHVRHYGFTAPPGVYERAREMVAQRFGNSVDCQVRFIDLAGAYRLRHNAFKKHPVTGRPYGSPRRDALAGAPITYPALWIRPRFG